MVEYNSQGKISSIFGIDIKNIFEEIKDHIEDLDDNVLDLIKKINNKIDESIPDKPKDDNDRDAI